MKKGIISLSILSLVLLLGVVLANAEEWVEFEGTTAMGEKLQLAGILTIPKGEGPFPAVVMLHPCPGLKDEGVVKHLKKWADRMMSWGYVSLIVDSFGPRGYGNICDYAAKVSNIEISFDAFSAKSYLNKLNYVDSRRMGVMGWSHGGWGVMAAVDGMYRDEDTSPFQAAIAIYPYCESFTAFDTPLLVLIGEKDDWCPSSRCKKTKVDAASDEFESELKLIVYPNVYHCFDMEGANENYLGYHLEYNPEAAADAIIQTRDFLAKYLKVTP